MFAHPVPGTMPVPSMAKAAPSRRHAAQTFLLSLILSLATLLGFGSVDKASAAIKGVAVTSVNLRAGPSTGYPVVIVMPHSASLSVHGCSGDRSWCDVSWSGSRGWVSASYIHVFYNGGMTVLTPSIAPVIGITTVTFGVAYWDRHYHGRPWHGHWNHYHGGGSRKVVAGCGDHGCGAAAVTRGPHGGGRAAVGGCGPEKCGGASVTRGPLGNTRIRHGSFDRP